MPAVVAVSICLSEGPGRLLAVYSLQVVAQALLSWRFLLPIYADLRYDRCKGPAMMGNVKQMEHERQVDQFCMLCAELLLQQRSPGYASNLGSERVMDTEVGKYLCI